MLRQESWSVILALLMSGMKPGGERLVGRRTLSSHSLQQPTSSRQSLGNFTKNGSRLW